MALTTYAGLKSAIADWLDRADLTSVIDDFIDLAETDIARELRVAEMVTSLSSAIASGVIAVPSGFLEFVNVQTDGTPAHPLRVTTPDRLIADFPLRSSSGRPLFIARQGANFIFGPYPDSAYTVSGTYYKKLTPLGDGTGGTVTTNYLTDEAPDLILAGSMMYAYEYLMDEQHAKYWAGKFSAALEAANLRDRRARLSRAQSLTTECR